MKSTINRNTPTDPPLTYLKPNTLVEFHYATGPKVVLLVTNTDRLVVVNVTTRRVVNVTTRDRQVIIDLVGDQWTNTATRQLQISPDQFFAFNDSITLAND